MRTRRSLLTPPTVVNQRRKQKLASASFDVMPVEQPRLTPTPHIHTHTYIPAGGVKGCEDLLLVQQQLQRVATKAAAADSAAP